MSWHSVTPFHLHKKGNQPTDYEDAWAVSKTSGDDTPLRVAVADGASEASFSAEWAKMLVRCYRDLAFVDEADLQARMTDLSKRWQKALSWRKLPWYAIEKARMGSFASLLGLEIDPLPAGNFHRGEWRAMAVGDTCLFHIRNDSIVLAWPIQHSRDFGNSPLLLSSNPARNTAVWSRVEFRSGEWQPGDSLILATDALASWFLRGYEQGSQPWQILGGLESYEARVAGVQEMRNTLSLKNDDVTYIVMSLAK